MKRICFVSLGNIYLSPYLNQYTRIINDNYDIIYWDRENLNEIIPGNNINIYRFQKSFSNKASKIKNYLLFKRYIKTILKKQNYDCIVFLQTLGAILTGSFLAKKYNRRYVIDIRDYSYEGNKYIYSIEKKLIRHSRFCVISSEGYKKFLPPKDYIIAHNIRELDSRETNRIRKREKNNKTLNIAFIGYVNYHDQHKKLLLNLKNDNRFILTFIGTKALELKQFCIQNKIKNVKFGDRFNPEEILKLYENVDLVNNLYGNHTPTLDYALSNKLYFAAELNIPILTCCDTFMSEISHKYDFGIDVDVNNPRCGDLIIDKYNKIDWERLTIGCEKFLDKVRNEQKRFDIKIKELNR